MPLFDIKRTNNKAQDKKNIARSKSAIRTNISLKAGDSLLSRINQIKATVETNLGHYKEKYNVILDRELLHDYITECIGNGYLSIDTETDGLDPLQNTLAGICIYTHGQHGSYIPLNHVSYITMLKDPKQLPLDFVADEFNRLLAKKPEIDMFNANFDIRFLRANSVKDIYCTWDGYLASRILNENEEHKNLKQLHNKYCLDGQGDAFRFDDLFKGIPFTMVPYNYGYLYAARDPEITTELCDYQRKYLRSDHEREDMRKLYWVFENIEMPCVEVVSNMEDNGILFDKEYANELSVKYNQVLEEKKEAFYKACEPYNADINFARWNNHAKIDDPINIASPAQIGILLYDILKIPVPDIRRSNTAKPTGEEALSKIDNPIAKAVLEYREVQKLLSTYIDKLPECVNPKDGRIHCHFNQYGADTGRMSSSDPNLQNIPSKNHDIRKMFVASPGYVLMSSDYSQQEPSCLTSFCKEMGYTKLYDVKLKGGDLYSAVASACYKRAYEDCVEFNADGSKNLEGKQYRNKAKPVLLGILYGRGDPSVAEGMGITEDEARQLKRNLYNDYPEIRIFEQTSLQMAQDVGYVTTICGRKRRLPDLQLPEYEFKWVDASKFDDILDFDAVVSNEVPEELCNKYLRKLQHVKRWEKRHVFEEANKKDGIWIIDNGAKIADAQRQCVNARIQGSAADLTKLAMIDLYNNEELKRLGFRMLIPVHDEIIAECPKENARKCSELLKQVMSHAAEKILNIPFKCDVALSHAWYGEEIEI